MIGILRKDWRAKVAITFFILFTFWWLYNNLVVGNQNIKYDSFFDFGETYGYVAIWGGVWGLIISRQWGGFRSIIGRSIIMFSVGLLAQEFGQLYYAIYNDIYKTVPFPSLGDFGYVGSIFLYIYGAYLLARAAGVRVGLSSFRHQMIAIILPLIMISVGYLLFLQQYKFDWSNPLRILIEFGSPILQAINISIAILTFVLTKKILGGTMRSKVLFILFALLAQFISDWTFLYQSGHGTYAVGSIDDYFYFCAYFLMTLAVLQFDSVLKKLKNK